MRISTGIQELDEAMGGGLPERASVLLVGVPGAGKTTFCNQFIYEGLKKGEGAIHITLNATPEEIINSMKSFGWDVNGKPLKFIDAYSWQMGVEEGKEVVNPANLTNFTIAVTKALTEMRNQNVKRVVIDSLSTMFLFVPKDLCLRFVSMLSARLKGAGMTILIAVEEGMHTPDIITALNSITDGTINFVMENDTRLLKINRMRETRNLPITLKFKISESGIEIMP